MLQTLHQFHCLPFRFICNLYKSFKTPVHYWCSGHGRQGIFGSRLPERLRPRNSSSRDQYYWAEQEAGQAMWGHFSVLIQYSLSTPDQIRHKDRVVLRQMASFLFSREPSISNIHFRHRTEIVGAWCFLLPTTSRDCHIDSVNLKWENRNKCEKKGRELGDWRGQGVGGGI